MSECSQYTRHMIEAFRLSLLVWPEVFLDLPLANLSASSTDGGGGGHPFWPMRAMTLWSFFSRLSGKQICPQLITQNIWAPGSHQRPSQTLYFPIFTKTSIVRNLENYFLTNTESTGKSYPLLSHFQKHYQQSELHFVTQTVGYAFLLFKSFQTSSDLKFNAFYAYILPHSVLPSFGKMPVSDLFTNHHEAYGHIFLSLPYIEGQRVNGPFPWLSPIDPVPTCSLGSGDLE